MSRIIALLAVLLSVLGFSAYAGAEAVNLVGNPSAEAASNGQPTGWFQGGYGTNVPSFSWSSGVAAEGGRYLTVSVSNHAGGENGGDAKWYPGPVRIKGGATYVASDMYASDTSTSFLVRFSDGRDRYDYQGGALSSSQTWKPASFEVVAPDWAVDATIFHRLVSNGTLHTDAYSLVERVVETPTVVDNVINPSVEVVDANNPNLPSGWATGSWGKNTPVFTYLKNGGHSGTHALRVELTSWTSGDAKWFGDFQPVTAGQRYEPSDWYRSSMPTQVYLAVEKLDGTFAYLSLPEAPASSSWAQYRATVTVPETAVRASIFHVIVGRGWLETDDYAMPAKPYAGFNRGLLSIQFDDGWQSVNLNAVPVLDEFGFKATHYLVSGYVGKKYYLSKKQAQELVAKGHQVGSHTVSHKDLTTLSVNKLRQELKSSQAKLKSLTRKPVLDFALPYGAYNATVMAEVKRYYASCRTVEEGPNSKDDFDPFRIRIHEVHPDTTTEELAGWIEQARTQKLWIVLLFHKVEDTKVGSAADPYTVTPAHFRNVCAAIRQSGVPVVTTSQAMAELLPQVGR